MDVSYKCASIFCDTRCRYLGVMSNTREDKIKFIRNGLSKESLDDILLTLDASHWICASRNSHVIYTISKRNTTIKSQESNFKRVCLPIYKKTGWEACP